MMIFKRKEEKLKEEERKKIYWKFMDECNKANVINCIISDIAIMSLSTIFLVVSQIFIKKTIQSEEIIVVYLFSAANLLFIFAIIIVIMSIMVSQIAMFIALDRATNHYADNDDTVLNVNSWASVWIIILSRISAIFFIVAILITGILYV